MSEVEKIKEKTEPILAKHPISFAGVFGSFARGEEGEDSDVDIMIRVKPGSTFSLYDLVDVESELAEKLGRKVDLFTEKSIDKYIRKYVLRDLRPIYQK